MSSTTDAADPAAELRGAAAAYDQATTAVERIGRDELEATQETITDVVALLEGYEDRATGTGDFGAYAQFKAKFSQLVDQLDDDAPGRSAFESARDAIDKRRIYEEDFEAAREALDPARELVSRLDEQETARTSYIEARRSARDRLDAVETEIEELERVRELGNADLDAPVEELRAPVQRYNESVREAFDTFRRETSARELFDFLDRTALYPLVPFPTPSSELRTYVETHDAGTEPVPTLLSYADYSRSKLDHYVDDAMALKRSVATNRTLLDAIDAEPVTIGWPPPPADELLWRCDELVSVVDRFAPSDVIATLHEIRRQARREEYDRLRTAARARSELTDEQRDRLASGAIERNLSERRDEKERLENALDEYPGPD